MATRGTGSKTTRQNRKPATTRKSSRKTTRKQQDASVEFSLSPEHQRELFALVLITIALITIIFFITGKTGGIGSVYVLGVTQAFGGGALVIPLALGALGLAILIQERMHDSPLTSANALGTFMVLGALLTMLEFPYHHLPYSARAAQGGGLVGYTLVDLLDASIGRPASAVLVFMLMLMGIILTFNVTLHRTIKGMATWLYAIRSTIWPAPPEQISVNQRMLPSARPAEADTLAYQSPPQDIADDADDIEPTPIAARLTRASLFKRSEEMIQQQTAPASTQSKRKSAPAPAQSQPDASGKQQPASASAGAKAQKATSQPPLEGQEHIQDALDGFDAPTVYRAWSLPSLDLLDMPVEGGISDEERRLRARLIEDTLASFKVEARVVGVNTGPAVTQFELQPAVGVKISKITSLDKDLALSLAAPSIRIEAPIPGKSVVGIEIPNSAISVVSLREVIDGEEFDGSRAKLKLPLGKDISGTPIIADMTKMPHLLVAGSTGSGKSVSINAFLCGLLLKHTPEELKLILVDPKMVELIVYNRIPHLLSPVVTELERVVPTLKWATREMERRYKIFARHSCRNLESYKQLARRRADLEPMPYILIVIDELADLMMMAPDEVETYICRLAQMARATGIHLILATQRPSVDVITGLIKANFPSRIAFAVTSQVDSRVILDTQGAEQLLGRGDMLYMAADSAKLVRIQGTYVSDREIEQIVNFWRNARPPENETERATVSRSMPVRPREHTEQRRDAENRPGMENESPDSVATPPDSESTRNTALNPQDTPESSAADLSYTPPSDEFLSTTEQDELLPQALQLVKTYKRASASLLQRRLRIGYSKAAQLIDLLEEQGIVGPAEGGRSREVLSQNEE